MSDLYLFLQEYCSKETPLLDLRTEPLPENNRTQACVLWILPAGAFRNSGHIHLLILSEGNLKSIEADAFADTSISYLRISISTSSQINPSITVKKGAFAKIKDMKIFSMDGIDDEMSKTKPQLVLEPFIFNGLHNPVGYMYIYLYENIQLPADLFTGLQVNQRLKLSMRKVQRIDHRAFGTLANSSTRISRLEVVGENNIQCDCEAQRLCDIMESIVGVLEDLNCIYFAKNSTDPISQPLQEINITCATGKNKTSVSDGVKLYLTTYVIVILIVLILYH